MSAEPNERPLLVFLNEVAGGRKLLQAVRDRTEGVSEVIVAAPQNQPTIGSKIGRDDLYASARARVEVTMSLFAEFGIDSVGEVLDPAPQLALGDAVRVHQPVEVFFSALSETRYGVFRKALVENSLYGSGDRQAKIRFILERIERHLAGKEPPRLETVSVEQVMPQTLTDAWRVHLGDDWETAHALWLHTLGNLTLVTPELNDYLGNRAWSTKLPVIRANSKLWLNQDLDEQWTVPALRFVIAMAVSVGFTLALVTKTLVSQMKRFFTSWDCSN